MIEIVPLPELEEPEHWHDIFTGTIPLFGLMIPLWALWAAGTVAPAPAIYTSAREVTVSA